MFLRTFGNITLNRFKNKYFIPSLVFFTATQWNLVYCSQSKLISVAMSCGNFSVHWHGNTSPWNQSWKFEAGRWIHSEHICAPHRPSAEPVLHLLLLSRVLGKMDLYREQVFLHLCCLLRWGFLPGFAISGRGDASVGLFLQTFLKVVSSHISLK